MIPEEIANEIRGYRGGHYAEINLVHESWITVHAVQSSAQVQLLLPTLDRGEAEVIALALEQHAQLVLLDELTGRKVAESLQLPVSGSVGILIRAKQMQRMVQRGVRYSQRFVTSILRQIGE